MRVAYEWWYPGACGQVRGLYGKSVRNFSLLSSVYRKRETRVERLGEIEQRMGRSGTDLLQGTLDLLILETLRIGEPMHGWGVSVRIQQLSEDVLQLNQGSLYPALHRLEHRGWIRSEWGTSENNRRAKFYRLTALGRRQLADERAQWATFTAAVERILTAEPA